MCILFNKKKLVKSGLKNKQVLWIKEIHTGKKYFFYS